MSHPVLNQFCINTFDGIKFIELRAGKYLFKDGKDISIVSVESIHRSDEPSSYAASVTLDSGEKIKAHVEFGKYAENRSDLLPVEHPLHGEIYLKRYESPCKPIKTYNE